MTLLSQPMRTLRRFVRGRPAITALVGISFISALSSLLPGWLDSAVGWAVLVALWLGAGYLDGKITKANDIIDQDKAASEAFEEDRLRHARESAAQGVRPSEGTLVRAGEETPVRFIETSRLGMFKPVTVDGDPIEIIDGDEIRLDTIGPGQGITADLAGKRNIHRADD